MRRREAGAMRTGAKGRNRHPNQLVRRAAEVGNQLRLERIHVTGQAVALEERRDVLVDIERALGTLAQRLLRRDMT
jgi:hypothetical protein